MDVEKFLNSLDNLFEKKSVPETSKKEKTEIIVKKLPVTGM